MVNWYSDKDISIEFDNIPAIAVRYILPTMSEDEKKSIKKYPFVNKRNLGIRIISQKNNNQYKFDIPKGYCFDGASVPRFFWRIIGSNTDNKFLVAAMVHDFMCEHHDCINSDRKLSTKIFDSLLKISEVGNCKRFLMKNSVDIFQKCFCHWG